MTEAPGVYESRFAASPSGHQSIPGLDACVELHSDTLASQENAAVSAPQPLNCSALADRPSFLPIRGNTTPGADGTVCGKSHLAASSGMGDVGHVA